MKFLLLLPVALLPACGTLTIQPDAGPPVVISGKDVKGTAKGAALNYAAWYLQQLAARSSAAANPSAK